MNEAVHGVAPAGTDRLRGARAGASAFLLLAGLVVPLAGAVAQEKVHDPLEDMNRAIFGFNMKADEWVLEPVARGYRYVAPEPVRRSVGNFLSNLRSPVVFVNDLLQGERDRAGVTLGRFMINTTLGFFGLFDPASTFGYLPHEEDFGQTLGAWGTPPGPYLMLPLLGPSSVRDTFGRAGDWAINPLSNCCIDTEERLGLFGGSAVSEREANIEAIDDLRRNSLDLYATVRTIYAQKRAADIRNGAAAPAGAGQEYEDIFKDEEPLP
jgi:phospholipid-binding lipoprotein MlaA